MTTAVCEQLTTRPPLAQASRHDLSAFMRQTCQETGASAYMVLDTAPDGASNGPRILVSNWVYDAIQSVGLDAVTQLVESAISTVVGATPRGWHPAALSALLKCERLGALAEYGHEAIFSLKLQAGRRHYFALVSTGVADGIDTGALARAQVACGYALSSLAGTFASASEDPLSERERECLFWVSEGKTTEEVALILDVSSNTINSYVAHAIHKLAASNRAMAIATAIRRGII